MQVLEKVMKTPFSFRLKTDGYEIEISGTHEEVLETIKELPSLVTSISKALEGAGVKTKANPAASSTYPAVPSSLNCSEAVVELLESEWGRKARTLAELVEALKANAMYYPSTTVSGVLSWLLKKNEIKRWKTNKGYVYVATGV